MTYGRLATWNFCQLSLAFINRVLYEFYLMIKVAILRRPITKGFSTWRFFDDAGSCYAVSNRGERKYFTDRPSMNRAITKWESYGYQPFLHTLPVKRGAKQLIPQLATA